MVFQAAVQQMQSDHWVSFMLWNVPLALNVFSGLSVHIVLSQGHVHTGVNEAEVMFLEARGSIGISS